MVFVDLCIQHHLANVLPLQLIVYYCRDYFCICLAKNIVSLCVQTILTHNAKAKSPDVNEGCGGGCVDYHSISWLLSLFS